MSVWNAYFEEAAKRKKDLKEEKERIASCKNLLELEKKRNALEIKRVKNINKRYLLTYGEESEEYKKSCQELSDFLKQINKPKKTSDLICAPLQTPLPIKTFLENYFELAGLEWSDISDNDDNNNNSSSSSSVSIYYSTISRGVETIHTTQCMIEETSMTLSNVHKLKIPQASSLSIQNISITNHCMNQPCYDLLRIPTLKNLSLSGSSHVDFDPNNTALSEEERNRLRNLKLSQDVRRNLSCSDRRTMNRNRGSNSKQAQVKIMSNRN